MIKRLFFSCVMLLMMGTMVVAQQVDSIPALVVADSIAAIEPTDEPLALEATEAPAELSQPVLSLSLNTPVTLPSNGYMDRISPKYGYYTPAKEFSFATVPLVAGGFIIKGQKKNFRRARADFQPEFHNTLDNYIQYVPLATAWGMRAFGVEGRSNWPRFVVSNVFSAAVMAGLVNAGKYTIKEMRPDGSTRNSFPSGHTATAFMAATILHKEYGLTRSPWYSVGAYALATTTGVMRSLNNRHWISDVMVGAGIGIVSTDLGYLFADLIFKDRGIIRTDANSLTDIRLHPSFFSASLATTKPFGTLDIDSEIMVEAYSCAMDIKGLTVDNLLSPRLKMGYATTVNAEGAYFINPYVGFGGRLEVSSMPVMAENLNVYHVEVRTPDGSTLIDNPSNVPGGMTDNAYIEHYLNPANQHIYTLYPGHSFMQSVDNLPIFSAQLGVYGSLPVSRRCAFGAKVLMGRRLAGNCDLDSYAGIIKEEYLEPDFSTLHSNPNDPDVREMFNIATSTAYESIDLEVKSSFVFTTGVNFTVLLRQNMGCKIYLDYSNSKFDYDLTYMRMDLPQLMGSFMKDGEGLDRALRTATATTKHNLNSLTGGFAVQLNF